MRRLITWPPEKPTATTPSSLPWDRNFGWIVDGEVMMFALPNGQTIVLV